MMRRSNRILVILGMSVLLISGFFVNGVVATEKGEGDVHTGITDTVTAGPVINNYSSLPELVEEVCGGAMDHFYSFFGPGTVDVVPLEVVGELPGRRLTTLGVTLADQMAARVSNDSVSKLVMDGVDQPQMIMGALQEMDGFLRVHIYGVNVRGERRSYVVNVEMSELLYRALHTFIS